MRNFNLAVVEGRLVGDPEIRYTQNGTALCRFSIANNCDYYKENELRKEVNFFDVTTWAKLAERCSEYLRKGSSILVEGTLKLDTWEDRESGKKRSRHKIRARRVQFLSGGQRTGGTRSNNDAAPAPAPYEVDFPPEPSMDSGLDDDLPPF